MAIPGTQRHLYPEQKERQLGWSAVVEANGFLFLAGIAAVDDDSEEVVGPGDPVAQVSFIYDQMERVLALYGATLEHVVQEVVFTTGLEDIGDALEERKRRYASFALPATAGCQVSALDTPGALIEVQATAVMPQATRASPAA